MSSRGVERGGEIKEIKGGRDSRSARMREFGREVVDGDSYQEE